ncbi:hypothetical protein [Pelosinus sp. IPA-1]|nr:hypothetical protein [Pelosinus sp. IPA-1]
MKKKWIIILLIGLVGFGIYNMKREGADQTEVPDELTYALCARLEGG